MTGQAGPNRGEAGRAARWGGMDALWLADSLPDILVVTDAAGANIFANRAARDYFGVTDDRMDGDGWKQLLHPDDRKRAGRLWRQALATQATYEAEYRYRRHDGTFRWFHVRGRPVEGGRYWVLLSNDVDDRKRTETALAESEERLRRAQEAGRVGTWEWDIVAGETHWSEACCRLWGVDPARTPRHEEFLGQLHPDDRDRVVAALEDALVGGAAYDQEYRIVRPDGEVRWLHASGAVLRDEAGQPLRLCGTNRDTTAIKAAEAQRELLLREVDHRARNALAAVQAILRATPPDDPARYADSVADRVAALARAHTLLSRSGWHGLSLSALVAEELGPLTGPDGPYLHLSGPPLHLSPAAAQPVGMVLHELATNAVKYGCLSHPAGHLAVTWRQLSATGLALDWQELGGPPVAAPPTRRGFGTLLLDRLVRLQLAGSLDRAWDPAGLRCTLILPEVLVAPGRDPWA